MYNIGLTALATIVAIVAVVMLLIFRRHGKEKQTKGIGPNNTPTEKYSVSKVSIAKREDPIRLNGWIIGILVLLFILLLNVVFLYPTFIPAEFYYIEGQLVALLWERMAFMPVWVGLLIATFLYFFATWFRPTLVFNAKTYWYYGKPEPRDGVYKFRIFRGVHLVEYQVAEELVTSTAMNYYVVGKPKKRGNAGIPDAEAIQTEQLEILHNNLTITERDAIFKKYQKQMKLSDAEVQSVKDLVKELLEAARGVEKR